MKICIIALLAGATVLMTKEGGAFVANQFVGIETRAGAVNTFQEPVDFYCTKLDSVANLRDAFQALQTFSLGGNSQGKTILLSGLSMVIKASGQTSRQLCTASRTTGDGLTSADGTISRYTFTTEEYFTVKMPSPKSEEDVRAGFDTLKAELKKEGLTERALLDTPFVMWVMFGETAEYGAFLAPA